MFVILFVIVNLSFFFQHSQQYSKKSPAANIFSTHTSYLYFFLKKRLREKCIYSTEATEYASPQPLSTSSDTTELLMLICLEKHIWKRDSDFI